MDTFPRITSQGPLIAYERDRPRILNAVASDVFHQFDSPDMEYSIRASLFLEKQRLQKMGRLGFSSGAARIRTIRDKRLWNEVREGLLKDPTEIDRAVLLRRILDHYAEEIGGHFNESIYKWVSKIVPWALSWLLNVASPKHILPWKAQESLFERLKILGESEKLIQLSKQGTILLVPTHQSNIDSLIVGYVTAALGLPPFAYGAGLNLFSSPLLGFFMGHLGAYTVDRQKSNDIYKEVLKSFSSRILAEGVHSVFFPGGGRSRNGAIESHLKLGLLGTGLSAQIKNLKLDKPKGKIFVVPMTTSYHFVLEASSLIEDYLAQFGKSEFLPVDEEENWLLAKALKFFWDLFNRQSEIIIRIGQPLDVFGNPVDAEGNSWGVNGKVVDIRRWCTSGGELKADENRDRKYTALLGDRIIDRYFIESTVLSSQAAAFALLKALRRHHLNLDIFHFLRLPEEKRVVPKKEFFNECEILHGQLQELYKNSRIQLSDVMKGSVQGWVADGMSKLGIFHSHSVAKMTEEHVLIGDLSLLYYYRNRLSGYALGLSSDEGYFIPRGGCDRQGFLA